MPNEETPPQRNIGEVLYFRTDISPFLIHLTRTINRDEPAKNNLDKILDSMMLIAGNSGISDARFGCSIDKLNENTNERDYFSAVSFTDTPLNEIHTLLEIAYRDTNLAPYGLVFFKNRLKEKQVSPVLYINNYHSNKDDLIRKLCALIDTDPILAKQILPYIAIFGKTLTPVGYDNPNNFIDFSWEREWRYTSDDHIFNFERNDIFIGLCPHNEMSYFEEKYSWLSFIDPTRNIKWYAEKLVKTRKKFGFEYSVV